MSWWTDLRDTAEVIGTGGLALAFNESARNKAEGLVNTITGRPNAAQRRQTNDQINAQIKAYQDQTNLTREELNRTRGAESAQKRLIQEKQIRTLRRNYRPQGIMQAGTQGTTPSGNLGNSGTDQSGMTNKLGG